MPMMSRRRFIAVSAAAAGCAFASTLGAAGSPEPVTWRGWALGAEASLTIHHPDRAVAERLVRRVVAEVERLEQIFSLYRPDSTLSQLNRAGALAAPPSDLVAVLEASGRVWKASNGAFDPTVQPLWKLLAEHFSQEKPDPAGPSPDQLRQAVALVGFDKLAFDRDHVVFTRRGMGLTLNGIAQGYITDRAVDILRHGGIEKSMVDMGEISALGTRPDKRPWRVGIANLAAGEEEMAMLELEDQAVATSAADGFLFEPEGRFNHLIDPRTGLGAARYSSVTVIAPEATTADAFATAFSLMTREAVAKVLTSETELQAQLVDPNGVRVLL